MPGLNFNQNNISNWGSQYSSQFGNNVAGTKAAYAPLNNAINKNMLTNPNFGNMNYTPSLHVNAQAPYTANPRGGLKNFSLLGNNQAGSTGLQYTPGMTGVETDMTKIGTPDTPIEKSTSTGNAADNVNNIVSTGGEFASSIANGLKSSGANPNDVLEKHGVFNVKGFTNPASNASIAASQKVKNLANASYAAKEFDTSTSDKIKNAATTTASGAALGTAVGGAIASGAASGSSAGPWGALAGAVVGAGLGIGMGIHQRKQAKRATKRAKELTQRVNSYANASALNAANNMRAANNRAYAAQAACGGLINRYDYGGAISFMNGQDMNNLGIMNAMSANKITSMPNSFMKPQANQFAYGGVPEEYMPAPEYAEPEDVDGYAVLRQLGILPDDVQTPREQAIEEQAAMAAMLQNREDDYNQYAVGGMPEGPMQEQPMPGQMPEQSMSEQQVPADNGKVVEINNGGTHEENPNQGVPFGIDANGVPNTVEEGEVVIKLNGNDMVISNRINVPKEIQKKYGLRPMKDITFAKAARIVNDRYKERENDPIAQRTKNVILTELANSQELLKQQEEWMNILEQSKQLGIAPQELMQILQSQGQEQQAQQDPQAQMEQQPEMQPQEGQPSPEEMAMQEQMMQQGGVPMGAEQGMPMEGQMAYGGPVNQYKFGDRIRERRAARAEAARRNAYAVNYLKDKEEFARRMRQAPVYLTDDEKKLTYAEQRDLLDERMADYKKKVMEELNQARYNNTYTTNDANEKVYDDTLLQRDLENGKVDDIDPDYLNPKQGVDWANAMRYAPLIGDVAAGIMAFQKPDYSNANAVEAAAELAGTQRIAPRIYNSYIKAPVWDRNHNLNSYNAQFNANLGNIANAANGNRSQMMNANIAAARGYQNGWGEAIRNADALNWDNRLKAFQLNSENGKFNAQSQLQTNQMNNAALATRLGGIQSAMNMRDNYDTTRSSAISAAIGNLATNLGNIGKEQLARRDMMALQDTFAPNMNRYSWMNNAAYSNMLDQTKQRAQNSGQLGSYYDYLQNRGQ